VFGSFGIAGSRNSFAILEFVIYRVFGYTL